jgi:hypothetical protein
VVDLKSFLPRLLPYVVGCPEPLALQALRDSAIEFCQRSLVLTTLLDPINLRAGVANYEIQPPENTQVAQTLKAWTDGVLLQPIPYEMAGVLSLPGGQPRYFYGQEIDESYFLTLLPTPEKKLTGGLKVRAALRPSRSTDTVNDLLYERYAPAVVDGAMGILMAVPNQPFTDFGMAGARLASARSQASAARQDALSGRVQSSLSIRMRAF